MCHQTVLIWCTPTFAQSKRAAAHAAAHNGQGSTPPEQQFAGEQENGSGSGPRPGATSAPLGFPLQQPLGTNQPLTDAALLNYEVGRTERCSSAWHHSSCTVSVVFAKLV